MKAILTQYASGRIGFLNLLLKNPLTILLAAAAISLVAAPASAQNTIRIKGHIMTEAGQPVANATIAVKGSAAGVSSSEAGAYELSAPSDSRLVISSIGYETQEVAVNGRPTINITLSASSSELDQLVVVGYGTQKKSDITGSVASIRGDRLKEVPAANFIQQLQGRIAGLDIQNNSSQPGASGQIRIRGERSLSNTQSGNNTQNSPLIVVDGVPFIGGSINDINQADIESVDVLKDASATAIYGSRGSNGVIIITTRKGKFGSKAILSYDGYYGVSNPMDTYRLFSGEEYAQYKLDAASGNLLNPGTSNYLPTQTELAGLENGVNTDWQDLVFRQGFSTDHQLSIIGGTNTTSFAISGGYHKDQGIVYGQDFTRYAVNTSLSHRINNRLLVGLVSRQSLTYTNGGGRYPVGGAVRLSPLVSPYKEDGSVNVRPQVGSIDDAQVSPLTIRDDDRLLDRSRRLSTINTLYAEVNILEGLKYRANLGFNYYQTNGGTYNGPNTFYNTAFDLDQSSESVTNSDEWYYLMENQLTYEKTFAQKHQLNLTGLYSFERNQYQSSGFRGTGIPADYFQNYNLAQASSLNADAGGYSIRGLKSFMGRVQYSYDSRYLLTATLRRDGSSVFPTNKYFTYPAVNIGWNIANEAFMAGTRNTLTELKLRAGYGKTSSQSISPYSSLGSLSSTISETAVAYNFGTENSNGSLVTTLANQNLTWEFTKALNIGLDFTLLRGRLSGSIDVYDQRTSGILQQVKLPASNGAGGYSANLGKTKGHGLEIALSSVNIKNANGFNWTTDFNISFNRSEIVELHDGLQSDLGNNWFVGQPFTVIYDYKKLGIWQDKEAMEAAVYGQVPGQIKIEDLDTNGVINGDDRQIIGNFQPTFQGGIVNNFSYKGIDLSIVIFSRIGQDIITPYLSADGTAQGYPFFLNSRVNQYKINYWTPTNPSDEFPRPNAGADNQLYSSTLAYRDGSFVKVRSINLGYTIPAHILNKAGISSLRIYLTCFNPFYLYSPLIRSGLGIDPEGNGYGGVIQASGATGNPTAGGGNASTTTSRLITSNINTPQVRTFQLGVNLKF